LEWLFLRLEILTIIVVPGRQTGKDKGREGFSTFDAIV
jgi:hypothetical protein